VHGRRCEEPLLEILRRGLEREDFCEGLFFLQSLAGGTGSGLGCFLLEMVSERFPELLKINVCVVPHLSGEVILQSYNCALSLASL